MIDIQKVGAVKGGSPITQTTSSTISESSDGIASFADILNNEIDSTGMEGKAETEKSYADEELVQADITLNSQDTGSSTLPPIPETLRTLRLRTQTGVSGNARDSLTVEYSSVATQGSSMQHELANTREDLSSTLNALTSRRASPIWHHNTSLLSSEPSASGHLPSKPYSGLTETGEPETLLLQEISAPVASVARPAVFLADSIAYSTPTSINSSPVPTTHNSVSPTPPVVSIQASLYDNRWVADFSQQIVVLARSEIDSAYIKLNPAELGPIQVTLNVLDGQASASFVSQDDHVRAAIEAALGDLREALAKSGVALTNTYVGSQNNPDRRHNDEFELKKLVNSADEQATPSPALAGNVKSLGIDVFA